ncbi:MAG TPA: stage II sporulation protein D [Mobilitalea sp.]|nr:stage II sporulation protein D [Mobilitalea sp.]
MKKILLKALIVIIVVLLFPFVLTLLMSKQKTTETMDTTNFTIYYEVNGTKDKLSFDDYLLGVIAANMPAGYDMEALKAQAVIARTYALYNISLLTKENPDQKTFTTSELGLSYIGLDALEQFWGSEDYSTYFTRLENAVYATKGEVLVYEDNLILPVFFDTCSGFTRNASEAWGVDVPYLVSVPSNQDVTSTNYLNIQEYEISDLISVLLKYYPDLELTQDNFFDKVKITERDSSDYVLKIDLGSLTVSGEEFAKVLGLPSNHFSIEDYEGSVRIICNGAGHGVGLSQYGANAMAEDGKSYKDILEYYYTGVDFTTLSE